MLIRFFEIENAENFEKNEKYLPLVSAERRKRVERMRDPKLKSICLLAEEIMRREIGKSLGMREGDIDFLYTEQGKPYIKNEDYHFSISHTENVIVFADSRIPVGIDIEGIYTHRTGSKDGTKGGSKETEQRLKVARRFFTEREYRSVAGAGSNSLCTLQTPDSNSTKKYMGEIDEVNREFCRIWTMKEAYIKMTGQGLLIPLDSFDVDNMESEVYYYNTVYKGFSISVCREGTEPEKVEILEKRL